MRTLFSLLLLFVASCATYVPDRDFPTWGNMYRDNVGAGGFQLSELRAAAEFCLDLNSQDDWNADGHRPDSIYAPHTTGWTKLFDSRGDNTDPLTNGIDPFSNAWTLWHKNGTSTYIVAIRGTIGKKSSAVEDGISTMIPTHNGIEFPEGHFPLMRFARIPKSEIHAGFAYGTFVTMFERDRGILPTVQRLVPEGSLLIITGHSQGAAMAALTHSFLHYQMGDSRFGLKPNQYILKSYMFAQPKPGNVLYSLDFHLIAPDNAWTFNNILDVVPRVPLTAESVQDVDVGMPETQSGLALWVKRFNVFASNTTIDLTKKVSANIADNIQDIRFYRYHELTQNSTTNSYPALSQNYAPAGNVVPLLGHLDGAYYPGRQAVDDFVQHHMTTYRYLINEKYAKKIAQ